MRGRTPIRAVDPGGTLWRRVVDGRDEWFTAGLGDPPLVGTERFVPAEGRLLRHWDPTRSKLGAALYRGYDGRRPARGERWLYLGAAAGTTATHVADLVGPEGAVFAVEKSVRPFARLLRVAERYPNLLPILADARTPDAYSGVVPPVDGLYADVAQPDQVAIVLENARRFLRIDGIALVALKTSSMGRHESARGHLEQASASLARAGVVGEAVRLDPFHRQHYLLPWSPSAGRRLADPAPSRDPLRVPRSGPRGGRGRVRR